MIRYGIVGIGGFARTWVQSLEALEETRVARLSAAVVRNRRKYAPEIARLETKACVIYPSLEAMLAEGRKPYDLVGVPTGIPDHAPMAIQAMDAGYNVLIEKPVAATVQEVRAISDAQERSGRWCAVGYQFIVPDSG